MVLKCTSVNSPFTFSVQYVYALLVAYKLWHTYLPSVEYFTVSLHAVCLLGLQSVRVHPNNSSDQQLKLFPIFMFRDPAVFKGVSDMGLTALNHLQKEVLPVVLMNNK